MPLKLLKHKCVFMFTQTAAPEFPKMFTELIFSTTIPTILQPVISSQKSTLWNILLAREVLFLQHFSEIEFQRAHIQNIALKITSKSGNLLNNVKRIQPKTLA